MNSLCSNYKHNIFFRYFVAYLRISDRIFLSNLLNTSKYSKMLNDKILNLDFLEYHSGKSFKFLKEEMAQKRLAPLDAC